MRRLSSILGMLVGVGYFIRAFMWAGGLDYLITAVALIAASIAIFRGARILFLSAAWGIFVGMNLFSFVTIIQGATVGLSPRELLLDLPLVAMSLGLIGLVSTFFQNERERST